jgi:hypothetical protein
MKKIFIAFVAVACALSACSDDDTADDLSRATISITPDAIPAGPDGTTTQVTVTSSGDWRLAGVCDWVHLPRRRDQQAHGTEQVHAAGQEEIQHVVEAGGVRPRGVDEGGGLLQIRDQRGGELVAARLGPLAVAGNGVDLAVVGEVAERLRQRPAQVGAGGKGKLSGWNHSGG